MSTPGDAGNTNDFIKGGNDNAAENDASNSLLESSGAYSRPADAKAADVVKADDFAITEGEKETEDLSKLSPEELGARVRKTIDDVAAKLAKVNMEDASHLDLAQFSELKQTMVAYTTQLNDAMTDRASVQDLFAKLQQQTDA
ncbi:MAG: hypothetical protein K2W82_19235 [Candidatus Obscuribacterales bacterium]|nr:hypothetical protein [Candidatus Obscuribacterales bacterium]